ncbi:MAG: hypothetical protein KDH20_20200 [Rhodocyclaceae bacterium]|nr:hypothetical protein [Rhodocyclaceae bacterium]
MTPLRDSAAPTPLHHHEARPPGPNSLLCASVTQRLLLAAAGLVPLWAIVWWALR